MLKFIYNKIMLPPPPQKIILFELDFKIKFPLLRLLKFLSDLKSTIFVFKSSQNLSQKGAKYIL